MRGLNILLVEDHPFQLISLEMQLNRIGFFMLAPALCCAEAMSLIEGGRVFDLLLCDQHLPDGLGIHLIEKAYELGGIGHAVLLSGIDAPAKLDVLLLTAHESGLPLLACLSKPLCMQGFVNSLSTLGVISDLVTR